MTNEVEEYYKNLLIVQYNDKPKAQETIKLNVGTLLANDIALSVRDGYNLDTAVGVQLDVLGRYIGVDRNYNISSELVGDFFSMTTYPTSAIDDEIGFTNYTNFDIEAGDFANYESLNTHQTMSDDQYRLILKLRVIQNNSDHSNKSIDDGLFIFFEDGIILSDNQNMSIVYFVEDFYFNVSLIALAKKVLPKPMGVRLNGLIRRDKRMFGFIRYTTITPSENITGFTNYTLGFTKSGEMLNYDKVINI